MGNPIRQLAKRILTSVLPRSRFITQGRPETDSVFITFDDGPHPDLTPALLDVLARESVAATFFLVGESAAAHPEIVHRMKREGHAIGNHTHTHVRADHVTA